MKYHQMQMQIHFNEKETFISQLKDRQRHTEDDLNNLEKKYE